MNSILESPRHHKLTLNQKQTESALKETMWYTQDGHVSIRALSGQSFIKFFQDEKLKMVYKATKVPCDVCIGWTYSRYIHRQLLLWTTGHWMLLNECQYHAAINFFVLTWIENPRKIVQGGAHHTCDGQQLQGLIFMILLTLCSQVVHHPNLNVISQEHYFSLYSLVVYLTTQQNSTLLRTIEHWTLRSLWTYSCSLSWMQYLKNALRNVLQIRTLGWINLIVQIKDLSSKVTETTCKSHSLELYLSRLLWSTFHKSSLRVHLALRSPSFSSIICVLYAWLHKCTVSTMAMHVNIHPHRSNSSVSLV